VAPLDVLIGGAGPAGGAVALSLASFAPELRVGLVDGVRPDVRVGETVAPQIEPVLAHLDLWQTFTQSGHCPSYRTMTAWGDARLKSNEFFAHTRQVGWRLDRLAFDRMLLDAAVHRVEKFARAKVVGVASQADGFQVRLSDATELKVRFLIDATGRAAALSRLCGIRPMSADRLVGCSLRMRSRSDGTEGLMTESFAEGWWYTVAVPGGDRVVVCMIDADRMRRMGLSSASGFLQRLTETIHVKQVAGACLAEPAIHPAGSRFNDPPDSLPLICVGDAATCFDPLSGVGILKALRSGILGSYAVGDWLRRSDERGLMRYRAMTRSEFTAYQTKLRDYYGMERRWPYNQFWRRRQN
jgi:2-polyprenyl-6-methoxyphenol hydroxylase-like FAD-dependent oxidoreductase